MNNRELAKLISSVLKNPNTPQPLKDVLHDAVDFFYQYAEHDSEEFIELCLDGYEKNGDGADIEITRNARVSIVGESRE